MSVLGKAEVAKLAVKYNGKLPFAEATEALQ